MVVGWGRGEVEVGIWVRSSDGKGHAFCWSWHTFRNKIIHLKSMLCWNPVTIALKLIYMYYFLSNKHTVPILVPVTNRVPVQFSLQLSRHRQRRPFDVFVRHSDVTSSEHFADISEPARDCRHSSSFVLRPGNALSLSAGRLAVEMV